MSKGYAIKQGDEINMKTVGPTKISAIVNGICVLGGVMAMRDWSDKDILHVWAQLVPQLSPEPEVIKVEVKEL